MGFRSLLEINHDNTSRMESDPAAFVADLSAYVRAGARFQADKLYNSFDVRVVGQRHSSDTYCIPSSTYGFPVKLPYDDFEVTRDAALLKAKSLTSGDRRTKRGLEDIITGLVEIIERQQEILDDI